ncbi:MAG: hydantoinase/oxoprolinase family protein [Pseudomonadota bacterium]
MKSYRIGIDVGGTFTDIIAMDSDGNFVADKVYTTEDQAVGFVEGIQKVGVTQENVSHIVHGTTVGTNVLISRTGAKTGCLLTEGFRDILLLRRQSRLAEGGLYWDPPSPFVQRRNCLGVPERIDCFGQVIKPFDEEAARKAVRVLKKRGMEALVVGFLHSFVNSENERKMEKIIQEEFPEAFCSVSSKVIPEIMEYERISTTLINSYIGPRVSRYMKSITEKLKEWGYKRRLFVMTSAGGCVTSERISKIPALSVLSGPAGGLIAADVISKQVGYNDIISIDAGGTSCDVGLKVNGHIKKTTEQYIEYDVPVRFPTLDVTAIGAGGGSIAWIDAGGVLRNGPQSAGSLPGPACYGLGGEEPTNTDVWVVLGYINPKSWFHYHGKELDPDLSRKAIKEHVADRLNMSVEEAAQGIFKIAINNVVRSTKGVSIERGHDPRGFALIAFGGSGPIFAAPVAKELGCKVIIIPPFPGCTSAMGLLFTDVKHDFQTAVFHEEERLNPMIINQAFSTMQKEGREILLEEGIPEDQHRFLRQIDIHYYSQSTYITIPLPDGDLTLADLKKVIQMFEEEHQREFGYLVPHEASIIEIANVRLSAIGVTTQPKIKPLVTKTKSIKDALKETRKVHFDGQYLEVNVYERARLPITAAIGGPCLIEQLDSTTLVPPGFKMSVDQYSNIIIKL